MDDKCLMDYKYYFSDKFNLLNGNSLEVLPHIADNSIDSIVTDPPYELGFMGKSWDSTGIANDVNLWKEVLRVLKPGGHLLAFSGSRTYHRMVVAIEDAGFEIRDQIMWVYGSGFPKSHNISKGIHKAAGAEREVVGMKSAGIGTGKAYGKIVGEREPITTNQVPITAPATPAAQQWDGWGTALKPAHEPIVLARKPFAGTVANNVLTYGTGGINIDASRVGTIVETWPTSRSFASGISSGFTEGLEKGETQATGEAPTGRWPANFIHDGSDEVVELFPSSKAPKPYVGKDYDETSMFGIGGVNHNNEYGDSGSAARFFYCAKASKRDRNEGLDGLLLQRRAGLMGADNDKENLDPVSERFRTQPSANHHPTVKPTDLMRYLCRLITPPGGTILDPFLGSGSTGKAAIYEGFKFVGIELTEEYLAIAKARIEFAINGGIDG